MAHFPAQSPTHPAAPAAAVVSSTRTALDEERAALARVLERVRDQYSRAATLGGTHSRDASWSGDAERAFTASAAGLAGTLGRARDVLEQAVESAERAAVSLAITETRLGLAHER